MLSRLAIKVAVLVVAFTLAGCHVKTSNRSGGDEELNAQAAGAYTQMALRQGDDLTAQMSSRVNLADLEAQLPFLYTIVPEGQPPVPTMKGYQTYAGTDGRAYTVLQDYAYADRTNHVTVRLIHEDDAWKILSFKVNVSIKAQEQPVVPPPPEASTT